MRVRLIALMVGLILVVAGAAPASAHPIDPPGNDRGVVAFAGGSTPAHTLGLACAEDRSPAVGLLAIDCTIGFGRG